MRDRRQHAQYAGVGDQDIKLAEALMQGRAQPVDGVEVGEVLRHQRRRAAGGRDGVVQLLQPADGAGQRHHMGALGGKQFRHRRADAAAGPGDQRYPPFQNPFRH